MDAKGIERQNEEPVQISAETAIAIGGPVLEYAAPEAKDEAATPGLFGSTEAATKAQASSSGFNAEL